MKNQCLCNQHLTASNHATPVDITCELGIRYGIKTFPVGDPYPGREVLQERSMPALRIRVTRRLLGRQLVAFSKELDVGGGQSLAASQETPHGAATHKPPQNPRPSIGPGGVPP